MDNLRKIACAALFGAVLVVPAVAAESIVIPAYQPQLGKEVTFHSLIETTVENKGASPVPRGTAYSAFKRRMTVTARNGDRLTAVWRLSADVPTDIALPKDARMLNDHYRQTLALWGIDRLTIETDASGAPTRVPDLPLLRAKLKQRVEALTNGAAIPAGSLLAQMLARLDSDPLMAVKSLIPEALLIANGQSDKPASKRMGDTGETTRTLTVNGIKITARTRWTLEAHDPNKKTVKIVWREEFDPVAYAEAQKARFAREIDRVRAKEGALSDQRLADLRRVVVTRSGHTVVSLRDGSTVEASETADQLLAGMHTITTQRVTRVIE